MTLATIHFWVRVQFSFNAKKRELNGHRSKGEKVLTCNQWVCIRFCNPQFIQREIGFYISRLKISQFRHSKKWWQLCTINHLLRVFTGKGTVRNLLWSRDPGIRAFKFTSRSLSWDSLLSECMSAPALRRKWYGAVVYLNVLITSFGW